MASTRLAPTNRLTTPKTEKIAVAYEMYEKKLRHANALDFDDLLLKTVLLLSQHESIRETLNAQYRFLMVDEYQDTNRTQYRLDSPVDRKAAEPLRGGRRRSVDLRVAWSGHSEHSEL